MTKFAIFELVFFVLVPVILAARCCLYGSEFADKPIVPIVMFLYVVFFIAASFSGKRWIWIPPLICFCGAFFIRGIFPDKVDEWRAELEGGNKRSANHDWLPDPPETLWDSVLEREVTVVGRDSNGDRIIDHGNPYIDDAHVAPDDDSRYRNFD